MTSNSGIGRSTAIGPSRYWLLWWSKLALNKVQVGDSFYKPVSAPMFTFLEGNTTYTACRTDDTMLAPFGHATIRRLLFIPGPKVIPTHLAVLGALIWPMNSPECVVSASVGKANPYSMPYKGST